MTTALLDPLLHHAMVFALNEESYRINNSRKRVWVILMEDGISVYRKGGKYPYRAHGICPYRKDRKSP